MGIGLGVLVVIAGVAVGLPMILTCTRLVATLLFGLGRLVRHDRRREIVIGLLGVVWFFNVLDAYRQAVLINYGYSQDLGLLDRPDSTE